ncbi:MAG: AMP-binding protein, partial [bacterium]|nr:AMP-binding protein [bacterium]
ALFTQLTRENSDIYRNLRYLLVGGDVLNTQYIKLVREKYPELDIINGYGPTENTTFSTAYLIKKDYDGSIPIGSPINNSTAYILNRSGGVQPIGIYGELVVGGSGVSRGYMNNPELTAERFVNNKEIALGTKLEGEREKTTDSGPEKVQHSQQKRTALQIKAFGRPELFSRKGIWAPKAPTLYKTGDLCRWLPDGNIEFAGRIDQQVKIRGFRIELGEIENLLTEHRQVNEAVVIIRESKTGDKYLCA